MSNLTALRRIALSSAKCCSAIHSRARGTDAGIVKILNCESVLASIIAATFRIKVHDVLRVIMPDSEPAPEPSPADYEHVRFMHHQYGQQK